MNYVAPRTPPRRWTEAEDLALLKLRDAHDGRVPERVFRALGAELGRTGAACKSRLSLIVTGRLAR